MIGAVTVATLLRHDGDNKELIALLHRDGFHLDWQDAGEQLDGRQILLQQKFYAEFRQDADKALFRLGFFERNIPLSDSASFLRAIAFAFVDGLAKNPDLEILREKTIIEPELSDIESILHGAPYMIGLEYLDADWVAAIWRRLNGVFAREIGVYSGTVAGFFASFNPEIHPVGRVFFHLVESKKDDYPFAFLATYSSRAAGDGRSKHLPLKNALVEYKNDNKKLLELLSTVNKASEKSRFVAGLIDSGEIFQPIGLTANEAYIFLKEIPLYEEAGILCRMPNWWKKKSGSLRLSISIGNRAPSRVGFDALVDFDVRLSLGDDSVTADELKRLLGQAEGLALIKGKWVEVDHEKLRETLAAYEQARRLARNGDLSIMEAMRLQLNAAKVLNVPEEACELEVTNGQWLQQVVANLMHPDALEPVSGGGDFRAALRGYQERGLAWLHFMKTLGLGACLADDMGLGKTVQVIALLNHVRDRGPEKTLLVVPASLVSNWLAEMARFAPSLRYYVLHPSGNKNGPGGEELLEDHDVFLTTYGMLGKYEWLKEVSWHTLVLDEAQAIKNPGTRQTRLVKQLKAAYRIAMTGTPIENRLSELWSLFDFLNKGLLGSAKEFADFTRRLNESREGYARLKKVVGPFILRRLKTDKAVIADLPDKVEMKTYATLTKRQAALYSGLVRDLETKLVSAGEGIEKKGLVLSSLLKFKQICNHPDQYLGQQAYAEDDSGKYARLREICETIFDKRERVLVFTQFREITEPLREFLASVFGRDGLVLHGGTPVGKRKDIIERFQGDGYVPFLVLSIKAGGVGLNLTAANHVIHFDRWWNPAVENQATDRAFRIGQKKTVIVHKFITKGTIEEKIDLMIEDKLKLTKEIIPDVQETWLTELDNKQLMDLFRLSI